MSDLDTDSSIILAVLQNFEKQLLPRVIEIKQSLDDGNIINEFDLEFLSEALHEARSLMPYLERHPEYEPFVCKLIHYYKIITDEALDNERLS